MRADDGEQGMQSLFLAELALTWPAQIQTTEVVPSIMAADE
jgi:hypothetical protein